MGCRKLQFEDQFSFITDDKTENKGFSFVGDLPQETSENNTPSEDLQEGFTILFPDSENSLENTSIDAPEYTAEKNRYKADFCTPTELPFGWTGMYKDRFTGLYHTHFREYDPIHGRWLSEDPAGYKDGYNLYNMYAGVNGVDVDGCGVEDDIGTSCAVMWSGTQSLLGTYGGMLKFAGNTMYQGLVLNPVDCAVVGGEAWQRYSANESMFIIEKITGKFAYLPAYNFGNASQLGEALAQNKVDVGFGVGQYYYDLTGNVATLGMYGQGKATGELYYGLRSLDDWTAQFGGTALIQLGSAGFMKVAQGRTPFFDQLMAKASSKLPYKVQKFLEYSSKTNVKDVRFNDLKQIMRPMPEDPIFAGHGYGKGDYFIVPDEATVTIPIGKNVKMPDVMGYLIESGQLTPKYTSIFGNKIIGARTYLSGAKMPNYILQPGSKLMIRSSSVTVKTPTPLSDLVKSGSGHATWAACTVEVVTLPNGQFILVTKPK